jgi:hypothetical protein
MELHQHAVYRRQLLWIVVIGSPIHPPLHVSAGFALILLRAWSATPPGYLPHATVTTGYPPP